MDVGPASVSMDVFAPKLADRAEAPWEASELDAKLLALLIRVEPLADMAIPPRAGSMTEPRLDLRLLEM